MDINWAINEINLLQEYYKENKAFKNICKSLKDIVVIFNSFEIESHVKLYVSNQIVYLHDNLTGDKDKDIDFCKKYLTDLYNKSKDVTKQALVNNIIIQIMTILILVKKNSEAIFNYTIMLLDGRPLTPITDDKNEWENVSSVFCDRRIVFQNKRASNVYMYKWNDDDLMPEIKMIDAIFYSNDGGSTWQIRDDSAILLKLPTMIPRSQFVIENK